MSLIQPKKHQKSEARRGEAFGVRLPKETRAALLLLAEQEGTSVSAQVNKAVRLLLADSQQKPPECLVTS